MRGKLGWGKSFLRGGGGGRNQQTKRDMTTQSSKCLNRGRKGKTVCMIRHLEKYKYITEILVQSISIIKLISIYLTIYFCICLYSKEFNFSTTK